jgi:hypothetical protein
MKRIVTALLCLAITSAAMAQKDSVTAIFAFPITSYMPEKNDSLVVVQVQLPDASVVDIPEKKVGVVRARFNSVGSFDTASLGWGRCQLVKGDYRYFGIHLYKGKEVQPGDLIYLRLTIPLSYRGYLFDLSRNYIHLQMVDDRYIYRREDVYLFNSEGEENQLLDSLVADIHYTGKVMLEQMPTQNQLINDGIFKGQKLFAAMQQANLGSLIKFLRYINARPQKYAGHSWKISEIFATWMVSGTPVVVGDE